MFSNALKSFSSNISSNYTLSPQPSSTAGPWKIFDAKRKNIGKPVSVFIFDKKSLDAGSSNGLSSGKGNSASLKRAQEEVTERLKREASSLARLRHPSILELVEPVEETRNGGLMFATEPVTASLASLLAEKDGQESVGGVAGKGSRYVVEQQDGTRRRRELEIDELEIQKGLLQLGKGLEFLHESAGLVHANLTPEAVFINAKGDWKLAGLGFCGPHETSTTATSLVSISLHEALTYDPRLPRNAQLNMDYSSPDFVLDNSLVTAADMFSLGLLIIAIYNSPHTSPLSFGGSISSYKRAFSSPSSVPTQSNNYLVPSSQPLPPRLASELLPRLITRRPAQRLTAREFQDASYFDNILVSTLRFLESLPAKTAKEKVAFMRGLRGIMAQFPASVLEKKILPALLEEMKDRELLAPILGNVFAMVETMPTGKRAFTEQVVPRLRDVFTAHRSAERDSAKEAGLVIVLENMKTIAEKCAGKEFREDILPIALSAMESQTPSLVDAGLSSLASMLPVLDFTTIKNELFPVVASSFSKTNSLAIKVKGLEAFYILCGGITANDIDDAAQDDFDGVGMVETKRTGSSAILDKYTVQEKIVPLLKAIKTKEPGVMMAALKVFKQVGTVADSDFLAMDVVPILWAFSLGPLLNLQQFQAFMSLIKSLSSKIEREQTKKLQELGSSSQAGLSRSHSGNIASGQGLNGLGSSEEPDFASLVSGRKPVATNDDLMNEWTMPSAATPSTTAHTTSSQTMSETPTFSWQTTGTQHNTQPTTQRSAFGAMSRSTATSRTITPDQSLGGFAALTPASPWATPLQPASSSMQIPTAGSALPMRSVQLAASSGGIDWSTASSASTWASQTSSQPSLNGLTKPSSSFVLAPPPGATNYSSMPSMAPMIQPQIAQKTQSGMTQPTGTKSGLDRFESLL